MDERSGAERIADERVRQIEQWGDDHDDQHWDGALAVIAAHLAVIDTDASVEDPVGRVEYGSDMWRLSEKHRDPIRRLEIAGALIAAEIDRLLRAQEVSDGKSD